MANQLIVTFVVLVILTKQSYSNTYQPENSAQIADTRDPKNDRDGGRDQDDVQTQDTTTNQDNKNSQQPEQIHPSGWGYGVQEEPGIGNSESIYGQGQNGDTATEENQGNYQHPDQSQTPNSGNSQKRKPEVWNWGTWENGYGQGQNGDTLTEENQGNSQHPDQSQLIQSGYHPVEHQEQNEARDQNSTHSQSENQTKDQREDNADAVKATTQVSEGAFIFGADNVNVAGLRENSLVLHSDGKNVTLGFSSLEFAIAMLDNVTLEKYTSVKTSNGVFHRMADLLKSSDPNGCHHVISSS